ncbi:MAG: hypothetical protein ACE5J3_12410, partial [Methanosarcinales archaeon]
MIFYLKENERIAVLRLGRWHRVIGPGLVIVFPIIEMGIRVSLDKYIPNWKGLPKEELKERVWQIFSEVVQEEYMKATEIEYYDINSTNKLKFLLSTLMWLFAPL